MMPITLAVDAMGGDHGVSVTVPAVLHFVQRHPDVNVVLVGQLPALQAELAKHAVYSRLQSQISCHAASEVVEMHESPQSALKNKKKFVYAGRD